MRFPGTNERVISIRGNHDAIKLCVNMIQEKIRNDEPPGNADILLPHKLIDSHVIIKCCSSEFILPFTNPGEGTSAGRYVDQVQLWTCFGRKIDSPVPLQRNFLH